LSRLASQSDVANALEADRLGSLTAGLFAGVPVITEAVPLSDCAPAIHPQEAAQVEGAVPRRQREFATGRACARRALARLGIRDFVLRNGPDRAPRWPAGVVGSITHTGDSRRGLCAVAVARTPEVAAVGLDAELGSLGEELWDGVLTRCERTWLGTLRDDRERGQGALLIFSAKECFYKAQYPMSGRFLEFGEVEIAVEAQVDAARAEAQSGSFEVRLSRRAPAALPLRQCKGRYAVDGDLLMTGITVTRLGPKAAPC
jgi:4'-phosphopantetheinyl transferase EntD